MRIIPPVRKRRSDDGVEIKVKVPWMAAHKAITLVISAIVLSTCTYIDRASLTSFLNSFTAVATSRTVYVESGPFSSIEDQKQ